MDYPFYIDVNFNENQLLGVILENWDSLSLPASPKEARTGYHQIEKKVIYWDGFQYRRVATEAYVNALLQGLSWKNDARAATIGDIDIPNQLNPGDVIDNVTLLQDDRVLVLYQADPSENGIYIVDALPYRALDLDSSSEFNNAVVSITEGDIQAGTTWRCTSVNPTVDVDPINFADFTPTIPDASELIKGKTAYASPQQVIDGNSHSVAVTPFGLDARMSPIETVLSKIVPPPPAGLVGEALIMNLYTALEAGTGAVHNHLTSDTQPTGEVYAFYNGDSGTLTAEVDTVQDGERVLSTANDVGVYDSLVITADEDPYPGVIPGEGLYKQLDAAVISDTALTVGEHTYQMKHSETGDSQILTFYVDDPDVTTITAVSLTVPVPARTVSGVPSLDVNDDILVSFDVNNAVRKHYNATRLASIEAGQIAQNNIAPPGTPPAEGAAVSYTNKLATVLIGVYSENIALTLRGYNSKGDTGTAYVESTNTRVDTMSDEQALRKEAGTGEYPVTFGAPYDSVEDLKTSYTEELQLLSGKYQWPTGNYSTNQPTPGPDYSSGMGSIDRWVLIDRSISLTNASSFILTLQDTEGTWSGVETTDIKIQVKVVGQTGWLDANKAFSLVGSPSANGDAAMVFSESSETVKKVTFGQTPRTGNLMVRIGLPPGSDKKFGQDVLISNIV